MMNRKAFTTALVVALLPAPRLHAQPVDKAVRIGLLASSTGPNPSGAVSYENLLAALRDLGWVDGKNLIVETRFAGPNPQRQREVAARVQGRAGGADRHRGHHRHSRGT